jgi:hypothetical protein
MEAMLYFTLNKGYQKRNNPSVPSRVYQNPAENPVDFNVAKYVPPLINGHHHKTADFSARQASELSKRIISG